MFPVLKKVQKGLPEFVASHLSVTFLILEGASFNVNQADRNAHYLFSGRQVPCGTIYPGYIFGLARVDIIRQLG